MTSLFWLCLVGSLLEMDTTYAFQLTLSRGIIAGPLLALLTGDLVTGLQVGIFTELIFIDINPLGGLLPPSAAVCCTISLALCSLGIPVYFSFFFGVIGAVLFSVGEVLVRKNRTSWMLTQEKKIIQKPSRVTGIVFKVLALSFIMTFIFVFCFSSLAGGLLVKLLPHLPSQMHLASKFAYIAVPWIGLAALVSAFRLKMR